MNARLQWLVPGPFCRMRRTRPPGIPPWSPRAPSAYVSIRAEEERARAEYAAAAASLEQARLNLEYTRVEAPISGRVRRALVTEGAFANQNEFTHLTTIEQIDPIYVRFSQPASQYSSLRRAVVSGLWKGVPLGEIKVRLLLSNGEEYPHSGRIIFSDMAVDPNTDTIEMRALFPNPDQEQLPGA